MTDSYNKLGIWQNNIQSLLITSSVLWCTFAALCTCALMQYHAYLALFRTNYCASGSSGTLVSLMLLLHQELVLWLGTFLTFWNCFLHWTLGTGTRVTAVGILQEHATFSARAQSFWSCLIADPLCPWNSRIGLFSPWNTGSLMIWLCADQVFLLVGHL